MLGGGGLEAFFRAFFVVEFKGVDWPRRASELLQLSVTDEEGLPRHLCKNCKAKVLSVEEKLQAQHTLGLLEEKRSVRKRAKDTSSVIVSPHTVAVRPACHYQTSKLVAVHSTISANSFLPVRGVSKLQAGHVTLW